MKDRRLAFVQYGDVRRIVATEDISIPGRIKIKVLKEKWVE